MSGINGGKKKEFHFNCKIKVHLHRYFQKIAFKSFCFLTSFVYIILCLENFLVRFSSRCLLLSVEYKVLQRRVFSFKKLWFKPINIQTYKLLLVVSTLISFCSWLLFLVMYFFFFPRKNNCAGGGNFHTSGLSWRKRKEPLKSCKILSDLTAKILKQQNSPGEFLHGLISVS